MGVFEMVKFELGIKGIMDVVVVVIKVGGVFIIGACRININKLNFVISSI